MHEWMNEWMKWVTWMNERMNEWMNEWLVSWMNAWTNVCVNEWASEWVSEWVREWRNEWMDEWMDESIHVCRHAWLTAWMKRMKRVTWMKRDFWIRSRVVVCRVVLRWVRVRGVSLLWLLLPRSLELHDRHSFGRSRSIQTTATGRWRDWTRKKQEPSVYDGKTRRKRNFSLVSVRQTRHRMPGMELFELAPRLAVLFLKLRGEHKSMSQWIHPTVRCYSTSASCGKPPKCWTPADQLSFSREFSRQET